MNMRSRGWRARVAAAACAASLLAGGGLAGATTVTGDVDGLDAAGITQCATVNLTMKLPAGNPFDDVPDGELPPGPLAGTTFTAKRIDDVDLTTAAGWVRARDMTVEEAHAAESTLTRTAVTDDEGTAVFADLPPGLYLVTATPPADEAHAYPALKDLLITLPTGGNGTWNCDPVVYAKPESDTPPPPSTEPTVPSTPPATTPAPPGGGATPPGGGKLPVTGVSVLAMLGAAIAAVGAGMLISRFGTKGRNRHV